MSPRPLLRTLEVLWSALEPLQLPMALLGGLAMATWKYVRATRDVDLLIGVGACPPDKIVKCVAAHGFRARRNPPVTTLGLLQVLQLEFEPEDAFVTVPADLLLADSEYHTQALQRCRIRHLADFPQGLAVLSCEDLILHKLLAGRVIDRADAVALLDANRAAIDGRYLGTWAEHLQLTRGLHDVWSEAFPDRSLPLADELK
jgi:hypothetical protein